MDKIDKIVIGALILIIPRDDGGPALHLTTANYVLLYSSSFFDARRCVMFPARGKECGLVQGF